jgi:asparagine synthase (glutamine-hydrolysing)
MCGICGFNSVNDTTLTKMLELIKHRGPDSKGTYVAQNFSLGHTRLSIIDLRTIANQPMTYVVGNKEYVIVFNGEIYNFQEIKDKLLEKKYLFKTNGDTEVILAAYAEWGEKCVDYFEGMWAFAIHDVAKETILISRDKIGIKPVYYYFENGIFGFSSEIKPLLLLNKKIKPNDTAIFDFLYYDRNKHCEQTFFDGVYILLPGHNLTYDIKRGKIAILKYYNLEAVLQLSKKDITFEEAKKLVEKELNHSITKMMVSEVPICASLSGGLDSSGIACAMHNQKYKDLKLYSLVFKGKPIDESKYQEFVAQKTGYELNQITFDETQIFDELNDLLQTHEEPFEGLARFGQFKIMEKIHQDGIKVVLDGQGADESYLGYPVYFGIYLRELFYAGRLIRFIRESVQYYKNFKNVEPLLFFMQSVIPKNIVHKLWTSRKKFLSREFTKAYSHRKLLDTIWHEKKVKNFSISTLLVYPLQMLLIYGDKNSMRWSIESRVPFCEHKMVELGVSLPTTYKIRDGKTKNVLKEALKSLLPSQIYDRKDKIGFKTPDGDLLRSTRGKAELTKLLADVNFQNRTYWNVAYIQKMIQDHQDKKADHGTTLWRIIIVERWFNLFFDAQKN